MNSGLLYDRNISMGAFGLLMWICRYNYNGEGVCQDLETIAKKNQRCTATIRKWIKELVDNGYIIKHRKKGDKIDTYFVTRKTFNPDGFEE